MRYEISIKLGIIVIENICFKPTLTSHSDERRYKIGGKNQ